MIFSERKNAYTFHVVDTIFPPLSMEADSSTSNDF